MKGFWMDEYTIKKETQKGKISQALVNHNYRMTQYHNFVFLAHNYEFLCHN